MKKPIDFYVYLHKKATDGSVFYIGKGYGRRFKSTNRSIYWKSIVAKHGYTIEIVQDKLQEWYAFELEIELILQYGRNNLCNLTDGGEGPSNPNLETREKMRNSHLGKKLPESQKRKIAASNTGRVMSESSRMKSSKSQKGIPKSDDVKRNMSIAATGRKASDETKAKLSFIRKGKKLKPKTEEQKLKLSVSVKQYFYKKKQDLFTYQMFD